MNRAQRAAAWQAQEDDAMRDLARYPRAATRPERCHTGHAAAVCGACADLPPTLTTSGAPQR